MSKTLTVEAVIPLQGSIVLAKWPEFGVQDFPVLVKDNLSLRLWFDASSTTWASQLTEEELKNVITPSLYRISATVTISDIADDFATWLESTRNPHAPENFAALYRDLADKVYDVIILSLNRLVSFIKVEKGQFWLDEYEISDRKDLHLLSGSSSFRVSQKARIDSGNWFNWYPPNHIITIALLSETSPRYMEKDDWKSLWQFVSSERKPALILELLAKAETLNRQGHERSALTEAVTALEIAVFSFSRKADPQKFLPEEILGRFDTSRLDKIIDHLGCTTTISWLFPLIFTEAQVSAEILKLCRDAVSQRQNVVHNGQRQVSNLENHLFAIRFLSEFLIGLTKSE